MKNFGKRLAAVLDEKNISQSELAKMAKTTDATISRYITGERDPKVEIVAAIAKALDISVDYLVGISDTPGFNAGGRPVTDEEMRAAAGQLNDARLKTLYGNKPVLKQTPGALMGQYTDKAVKSGSEDWTDEDISLMRHIKNLGERERMSLLDYVDYLENRRRSN